MSTIADLPASAVRQFRETRLGADATGLTARAVWVCDYADLPLFMQVAGGLPQAIGTVIRIVPLVFPDFATGGNLKLYCSRADAEAIGHNGANPGGNYTKARVTLDFKTFPFPIDGSQAFMTVNFQSGGRVTTGPPSAFTFGAVLPSSDMALEIPGWTMQVTLFQLQQLAFGTYASLTGKVNSSPFLNFGTGQVFYRGVTGNGTTTVGNQTTYQVTHELAFSAADWNYEPKPGATGLFPLFFADGSTSRYPYTDLSPLLS